MQAGTPLSSLPPQHQAQGQTEDRLSHVLTDEGNRKHLSPGSGGKVFAFLHRYACSPDTFGICIKWLWVTIPLS